MRFFTCPQHEQRFVEGNQREAMNRSPPALATLVLSNCNRCPIAASATALASFRLAIIPRVFDPDDPARPRQFGAELVLYVPAHIGDLLMLACHLEPLLLIIVTEDGSLGLRILGLLFL